MLAALPKNDDPNLLVGFETSDDAAVYRLGDDQAMVMTADFITPPVDDPYLFGQIAAANALSDVFAMGARPVACLNLVGFPADKLAADVLHRIIAGAVSKITEAGAVLAGGHTTEDDEPKFGLAVVGLVHPERVWKNVGAVPGDALILTKPLGSGVLFNANRKSWVSDGAMDACLDALTTLNRTTAEVLAEFEVHAVTDVTGFGLAGHALEMAEGSTVTLELEVDALPLMAEALAMYRKGMSTGVNKVNHQRVDARTRFDPALAAEEREILVDPQTSGGLLAAVPEEQADEVVTALHEASVVAARRVGRVVPLQEPHNLLFTRSGR